MNRFLKMSLGTAVLALIACDLGGAPPATNVGGCWTVVDSTYGELFLKVDTGSLNLMQSGDSLSGTVVWKDTARGSEIVGGSVSGDSLHLWHVTGNLPAPHILGGILSDSDSFRAAWHSTWPPNFPSGETWVGTRAVCIWR